MRRVPRSVQRPQTRVALPLNKPVFSIVIPAYDEEKYLPKCLDAIERARVQLGDEIEVIVADNMSSDRTAEVARARGARVIEVKERNISTVRNTAAKSATGKYLVFLDADSYMAENMLVEVKRTLDSDKYIGGGVANFRTDRMSLGIFVTFLFMAIYTILFMRISWALFYMRRETFDELNGFNTEILATEDIDFARRLKRLGNRMGLKYMNLMRSQLITSSRKFDEYGDWMAFKNPLRFFKIIVLRDRDTIYDFWYRPRR